MDITYLFKAAVMTVKLQRQIELRPQRILSRSGGGVKGANGQRDEFSREAKFVCQEITTLKNVLLENRLAYMHVGEQLKSYIQMTEEQRDLIDKESERFFDHYHQHLTQMRNKWLNMKLKAQQHEHISAVLDLLFTYMKAVQQISQALKKFRIQYELDTYRMLKLVADKKLIPVTLGGTRKHKMLTNDNPLKPRTGNTEEKLGSNQAYDDLELVEGWQLGDVDITNPTEHTVTSSKQNNADFQNISNEVRNDNAQRITQLYPEDEEDDGDDNDNNSRLSPEDIQMFEEENEQLYQELQGVSEEVEAIGKNVVHIANLQDIFSEKVSLQQHNIERIVNAVIGATENVKDANEQIKAATQRNAGLRVWSLFFLLVMSFTLLFLDWYYD